MNSMFKNALMVTLLVSAGSAVCSSGDDVFFGGVSHEAPMGPQGYWAQLNYIVAQAAHRAKTASTQALDYARTNTPEWVAQTFAYLAEMPKSVDGASLGGYATADNAKNVLAKAGVAAVVAAAAYGIYKVAFKKAKKEVNCASIRLV